MRRNLGLMAFGAPKFAAAGLRPAVEILNILDLYGAQTRYDP